jgi:acyl-CoA synthetase (AMP-forming)/AMP-acid ligase II
MRSSDDPRRQLSFGDVLREQARSRPGHPAVADGDTEFTYVELDGRVNALVSSLASAGVGTGSRVAWLGQNSFRLLECLLASAKLGAIFAPLNWRMSAEEAAFALTDLEPDVVVWQAEEFTDLVSRVRTEAAGAALWLQHDDPAGYEAFLAAGSSEDQDRMVPGDTPLLAVYTAAFDGRPNAALLTHTALVVQNLVIGRTHDVRDTSVHLNSGPLFHVATLMLTNATVHHGGLNVFTRKVDATTMCELIERHRVTHAFVTTPTVEEIRSVNAGGRYDLSSLWSQPDLSDHHTTMVTPPTAPWAVGPGGYGQTEAVGLTTFIGLGGGTGSVGRSSPAIQLRVVDEDGNDAPAGEVGEIVLRGPTVMAAYLNRPEENAARSRGGWHQTRDLGRREPDGSVSFVGPKTVMIKTGAENVYPAEVETCLGTHPAVAQVCVYGVPDAQWGQNVHALVVLREGMDASEDELIAHCRKRIASYKKPRSIVFTDALPRTPGGLVDRAEVDRRHGGGGYPGQR